MMIAELYHLNHVNQLDMIDTLTYPSHMPLLQVRQAAQHLGVHENTLRRWEQAGYIKAVKLPSGVRRFRPEDIELTRQRMYDGLAPLTIDEESDDVVAVQAQSID